MTWKVSRTGMRASALAWAVAAGSALVATTASAQATGITDEQARAIALQHVPGGTIEDLERDDEDGRAVIEIEIRGSDGREHELTLDARDGSVISTEIDDDTDEAEDGDD